MGIVRKALFISTAGLSDRVLGEETKKRQPVKPARSKPEAKAKTAASQPKSATAARRKSAKRPARRPASRQVASPITSGLPEDGGGVADELDRIAKLRGQGLLSETEFRAGKAKILGIAMPEDEPFAATAFPAVEANVLAARRLNEMAEHVAPAAELE